MDLTQAITLAAIIFSNITTIIVLYCHLDNKTDKFLQAIHQEMKDFHGRLCSIEEKNKGK